MQRVLMKCGHVANAINTVTGEQICVICYGIHPGASEISSEVPSLEGRTAKCIYHTSGCRSESLSSLNLCFFKYQPDMPHDSYYCGCMGWK